MATKKENKPDDGVDGADVQDQGGKPKKDEGDKTKAGAAVKPLGAVPMDDQPGPEPEPEPVPEGPVYGMVPYPHRALIIPEGGFVMPGEELPADLIIGREWTEIPVSQLDRVKRTAQRAGIKLELMIPDPDNSEE